MPLLPRLIIFDHHNLCWSVIQDEGSFSLLAEVCESINIGTSKAPGRIFLPERKGARVSFFGVAAPIPCLGSACVCRNAGDSNVILMRRNMKPSVHALAHCYVGHVLVQHAYVVMLLILLCAFSLSQFCLNMKPAHPFVFTAPLLCWCTGNCRSCVACTAGVYLVINYSCFHHCFAPEVSSSCQKCLSLITWQFLKS
ncbi:hypothetical protein GOP47_0024418 [Adiantum capillus-veneris]|uniref:Uncharacterized protein n=1 Tax=Adiantum capillus-veneris TaxID=13818 RepID=A0A9D4U240_ADICA|nr:hypothetical protein GOP47_0024418 [Adiantum capillus-veneris]